MLKGVNATSGASDLSMDPTNPRILYAAFWDHQRLPWQVRSGGPGSGIWKSTDGGDTWTRLSEGLPKLMGKIGVAVSPANPDRVFAIVEAEPRGGLYRSDDAGKTWRLLSENRDIQSRPWYYMNITADPQNADVVYVMNAPIMKSIDGGRTFTTLPATHGDNHGFWINPKDSRVHGERERRRRVDLGRRRDAAGARRTTSRRRSSTTSSSTTCTRTGSTAGSRTTAPSIIKSRSDGPNIGDARLAGRPRAARARTSAWTAKNPRYIVRRLLPGDLRGAGRGDAA